MTQLLCSILQCGYLDITFFDNLLKEFSITLDYNDIVNNYGKLDLNTLIYCVYEQVKDMFISQNIEEIKRLTEKSDAYDIEYSIFTNFLDSHLWFRDQEVEELFQNWRDKVER